MKHEIRLEPKQELKQVLKPMPRLILEAKLLELPLLELQERIKQEALQNPCIELQTENPVEISEQEVEAELVREIRRLSEIIDTGDYSHPLKDEDEERDRVDERWIHKESIWTRIEAQVEMEFTDELEKKIAFEILDNLDDRGFLVKDIKEIAEKLKIEEKTVENIRRRILQFDPFGIGSRDVNEFLLLQLEDRGFKNVKDVKEFIHQNPDIAKFLVPYPLYKYEETNSSYVFPEIIMKAEGDEIKVEIEDKPYFNLRINTLYADLLNSGTIDSETRKFLREKLKKAEEFLEMILKRRNNIRKVAEFIATYQKDFLLGKSKFLKPLTQKEAAEMLDIQVSTLNRIVKNKYADTPRGIFELRFFFKKSVGRSHSDVSEDELLVMIKEIIENENPQKPYSDEEISRILRQKGIKISRRTVREKRAQLGIPSSSKRRKK